MARGVYTVSFDQQTIAASSGDYDFFEFTPADDKAIELVGLKLGNKSEITDAQEEMVAYAIMRGHATSGSGGGAPTPQKTDSSDGNASFTAETCNSAIASAGTNVTLVADTFNIRGGLNEIYPEAMRIKCTQADGLLVVRLTTALTDDATFSGTAWIREL